MRIRKNAKLSPLLFSSWCIQGASIPVETHVCQLNQSPWDVIPFHSDSIQFQLDDSFATGNNDGSVENSFGAVESAGSMMNADRTYRHSTTAADDNNKATIAPINIGATKNTVTPCQFDADKVWPCKNEVRPGQSFCEQHLSSSLPAPHHSSKKSQSQASTRRGKTRGAAGKKASSNPYEFYYYSGFGPLWGKRRSDRNGGEGSKNSSVENSAMVDSENVVGRGGNVVIDDIKDDVTSVKDALSIVHEEIIDYDDDEEEGVDDSGKKRTRKPVKARSLKSLM